MSATEARPLLDAILRGKLPVSARNLFLAERMRLAVDWEEILRYGVRTAAGKTTDGVPDVPGGPSWPGTPREEPVTGTSMKYFDDDAAYILNRDAPLAVLRQAAQSPLLPENLRLEVARAAWVRSIMLGGPKAGDGKAGNFGGGVAAAEQSGDAARNRHRSRARSAQWAPECLSR